MPVHEGDRRLRLELARVGVGGEVEACGRVQVAVPLAHAPRHPSGSRLRVGDGCVSDEREVVSLRHRVSLDEEPIDPHPLASEGVGGLGIAADLGPSPWYVHGVLRDGPRQPHRLRLRVTGGGAVPAPRAPQLDGIGHRRALGMAQLEEIPTRSESHILQRRQAQGTTWPQLQATIDLLEAGQGHRRPAGLRVQIEGGIPPQETGVGTSIVRAKLRLRPRRGVAVAPPLRPNHRLLVVRGETVEDRNMVRRELQCTANRLKPRYFGVDDPPVQRIGGIVQLPGGPLDGDRVERP